MIITFGRRASKMKRDYVFQDFEGEIPLRHQGFNNPERRLKRYYYETNLVYAQFRQKKITGYAFGLIFVRATHLISGVSEGWRM